MRYRQQSMVKRKNLEIDSKIREGFPDDRKCIALFSFFDNWEPSDHFSSFMSEIMNMFPSQNIYMNDKYGSNVIHFTLMQLVGFEEYNFIAKNFEDQFSDYEEVIRSTLLHYLPFSIHYRGAMAISCGLIIVGYPSIDVNSTIRKRLYSEFDRKGLHYRKYTNNIVHSTVMRVSHHCETDALGLALKYNDSFFGTLLVEEIHLSHASWRMQSSELKNLRLYS